MEVKKLDVKPQIAGLSAQSVGKRSINIDIRANPQLVDIISDMPGVALQPRVRIFQIDDAGAGSPYYQIDMGEAVHEDNLGFGLKSRLIQVLNQPFLQDRPFRFKGNRLPKRFLISIYNSLEIVPPGTTHLTTLGGDGCQIMIDYEFIPE